MPARLYTKLHPGALRTWVRQAEIDGGLRPGTTTDDTSRISELERDIRELRQADEILHTAAAFSPQRSRLRASTYRAGVLFVLPGMLALLGLSAVYVAYDDTRCRPKVVSNSAQAAPRETTKMRILASEDGVNGTPSVRSRDHSRGSIGDFLRRYTVQVSNDGRTWTDIAMGPGRPSLTGEMVIALPSTTARYLRLVSGATAGSWWSIHELNLRTVAGSADPGRPSDGLVRATGWLPDATWVGGYYNSGSTAAEVPWPIDGFRYTYRLPPTAAVTFALPGSSPATQRADPASTLERPGHGHHPPVTQSARHRQHDPRAASQLRAPTRPPVYLVAVRELRDPERDVEATQRRSSCPQRRRRAQWGARSYRRFEHARKQGRPPAGRGQKDRHSVA